jgi:hypothetical protein
VHGPVGRVLWYYNTNIITPRVTICLLFQRSCTTDHCAGVSEVRNKLSVSKQTMQKFHTERSNLKKLNIVEVMEQHQVKISVRFTSLENSDDGADINGVWETVRENIKISAKQTLGYYEQKWYKTRLDKEC